MNTEDKLDMALDDIPKSGKVENTPWYNRKRADRRANSSPYADNRKKTTEGDSVQGRKVYVGNLAWSVSWQQLKDHMSQAGEVEHADVLENKGRSRGCGLVTYSTVDDAENAIATLNDTELDGRKIFVREDREEKNASASTKPKARVYVGNLPYTVRWQELKDLMKSAGTVLHADVLSDNLGRSKGCGLVEYSSQEEAQEAIFTLNDTEFNGRTIFVREDREPEGGSISSIAHRPNNGPRRKNNRPSNPRSGGGGDKQVYVGNLPFDTTWQDLKDHFRDVGVVERTEVPSYPDGKSRGFGIVRFAEASDAANAITNFNGTEFNGRNIEVRLDRKE